MVQVDLHQIPDLVIYYGFVASALYVTLFFFYVMAIKKQKELGLNEFELFMTKQQKLRIIIMFSIPLLSILVAFTVKFFSITLASILSGMVYGLYVPAIMTWSKRFQKRKEGFSVEG
jgi:prepilin signal peptidase PulO-like enzyme (type II secretory pathway)